MRHLYEMSIWWIYSSPDAAICFLANSILFLQNHLQKSKGRKLNDNFISRLFTSNIYFALEPMHSEQI